MVAASGVHGEDRLNILIIAIVIIILGMIVENIRELHGFRTTVYKIASPKLMGLQEEKRIVFLSDLHNYSYGEENGRLFQAIISARPDLILIGGDMLVRKDGNSYEDTLRFLCRLPSICKVYYANGNHEQKLKERPEAYSQSYKDYQSRLCSAGIVFLENESVRIPWDGAGICITGLEIGLDGYRKFGRRPMEEEEIESRVGAADSSYQILLAHNPAYVEAYRKWGADLILSGHLHGGIVRIPGIGGVIAPDLTLFPKYSGDIYREEDATVVVSKGLGAHSVPIRLLNPAEMVVLVLNED